MKAQGERVMVTMIEPTVDVIEVVIEVVMEQDHVITDVAVIHATIQGTEVVVAAMVVVMVAATAVTVVAVEEEEEALEALHHCKIPYTFPAFLRTSQWTTL